ncbi:serine-rich adhesin for platelets-like [Saccostrea echinata]|uniref:serine-rich adhesin for platelets-like n=1 Tax=Saccostrea echinata TaxID=191078 RepID=UPI002A81C3FC|nr:serine-rich adhesin for platelets-like [Saccostrea echinata]
MNEYRNILTGDAAVAWRSLISRLRFDWTTDNKIFEHLLEVHEWFCGDKCPLLRSDVDDRGDPDFPMSKEDEETAMSLDLEVEDGAESVDDDSSGESESDTESGEDVHIKEEEEEIISEIPCKIVSTEPSKETIFPESGGDYPVSGGDNFVPLSETLNSSSKGGKYVSSLENNSTPTNKTIKQRNIQTSCLNVYRKTSRKTTNTKTCSENQKQGQNESETSSDVNESQKRKGDRNEAMLEKKLRFKLPQGENETFLNVYELQRESINRTEAPPDTEKKLLFKVLRISSGVKKDSSSSKGSSTVHLKYPKLSLSDSLTSSESSSSSNLSSSTSSSSGNIISTSSTHSSKPPFSEKPESTKSKCPNSSSNKMECSKPFSSNKLKSSKPSLRRKRSRFLNTEGVKALRSHLSGRALSHKNFSKVTTGTYRLQGTIFNSVGKQVPQRLTTKAATDAKKSNTNIVQKNNAEPETQKPENEMELKSDVSGNKPPISLMLDINPDTGIPCLVRYPTTTPVIDNVNLETSNVKSEQTGSPGSDSVSPSVQGMSSLINLRLTIDPVSGKPMLVKCPDEPPTRDCDTRKQTRTRSDQEESRQLPNFSLLTPNEVLDPKLKQIKLISELQDLSKKIPNFQKLKPKPMDQKPKAKLKQNKLKKLQGLSPKTSIVRKTKQMPIVPKAKQTTNHRLIGEPQILNSKRPVVQQSSVTQEFKPSLKQHENHHELIRRPQVLRSTMKELKQSPVAQESNPTFKLNEVMGDPQISNTPRPISQKPRQSPIVKESEPTSKQNELIGEPQILRNLLEESNPTLNLTLIINPANGMPVLVRSPDLMTSNPNDKHLKLTLDPVSGETILVPESEDDPRESVS